MEETVENYDKSGLALAAAALGEQTQEAVINNNEIS